MSLENTFGNAEKPTKEKKLEVITSKDTMIHDLRTYFEQNKYRGRNAWDDCREYFDSCINFLQSFKVDPGMIKEFYMEQKDVIENEALCVYISAMMQTSYNQGCNDFVFEEVKVHCFGAFLKSQPENMIRITTKKLEGNCILPYAENCSLETETLEGNDTLCFAKNCTLTAENICSNYCLWYSENCSLKTKTLKGYNTLLRADSCSVEIQDYEGNGFGFSMKNSIIKSGNKETLELLKERTGEGRNNKFELKK